MKNVERLVVDRVATRDATLATYLRVYFQGALSPDPRVEVSDLPADHVTELIAGGFLIKLNTGQVVAAEHVERANVHSIAARREKRAAAARAKRAEVKAASGWDPAAGARETVPDLLVWATGKRAKLATASNAHGSVHGALASWFASAFASHAGDQATRERCDHLYAWWCATDPDRERKWARYRRDRRARDAVRRQVDRWWRTSALPPEIDVDADAPTTATEAPTAKELHALRRARVLELLATEEQAGIDSGEPLDADLWARPWPTEAERARQAEELAAIADAQAQERRKALLAYVNRAASQIFDRYYTQRPYEHSNYSELLVNLVGAHLHGQCNVDGHLYVAQWREDVAGRGPEIDAMIERYAREARTTPVFWVHWAARRAITRWKEKPAGSSLDAMSYLVSPLAAQQFRRDADRARR